MDKPLSVKHLCNWGGIEIWECTCDYVVAAYNFGNGTEKMHRLKIYLGKGDSPYFNLGGRQYLKDFICV